MSRKDYIAAAAAVARQMDSANAFPSNIRQHKVATCVGVAHGLATMFERDSSGFNRDRFLSACKVQ